LDHGFQFMTSKLPRRTSRKSEEHFETPTKIVAHKSEVQAQGTVRGDGRVVQESNHVPALPELGRRLVSRRNEGADGLLHELVEPWIGSDLVEERGKFHLEGNDCVGFEGFLKPLESAILVAQLQMNER
jgi:hypothetical protein